MGLSKEAMAAQAVTTAVETLIRLDELTPIQGLAQVRTTFRNLCANLRRFADELDSGKSENHAGFWRNVQQICKDAVGISVGSTVYEVANVGALFVDIGKDAAHALENIGKGALGLGEFWAKYPVLVVVAAGAVLMWWMSPKRGAA